MWILPKQLHTLACARATEVLTLDSTAASLACAQSLMRRSKHSQSSAYLREWKAGNLMRVRSGLICEPSLGQSFATKWISSVAATRASHSQQLESGKEQTTLDTSGHLFQPELLQCDQVSVSLKTSRDISRWGCPTLSKTWQDWVTEQRGAYSARLKLAHRTRESGCSSWPTASARDWKDSPGMALEATNPDGSHRNRADQLARAVANWPTPQTQDTGRTPEAYALAKLKHGAALQASLTIAVQQHGPHAPASSSTGGNHLESWSTATVSTGAHRQKDGSMIPKLDRQVGGKLNPRWVETLMGLPVGWVMPSCASPISPAAMNCDCWATALCQPPQSEPFEFLSMNS